MKSILTICTVFFLIAKCQYSVAQQFPCLVPFKSGNLWGYSDTLGKEKIKPMFLRAGFFLSAPNDTLYNPAARVILKDGKETIINPAGVKVLPMGFIEVKDFIFKGYLFFQVTDSNRRKGIYLDGIAIVPVKYNHVSAPAVSMDDQEVLFTVRSGDEVQNIRYKLPVPEKNIPSEKMIAEKGLVLTIKNKLNAFTNVDLPALKKRFILDSISFIEKGLAYVEKNKQMGFLVYDKVYLLKQPYTIISVELLDKFADGCSINNSKLLIVVQIKDKYLLMDETEKNFFKEEFTDTEGNLGYVVVKETPDRIGFFVKNMCYSVIPVKYEKFIDPIYLTVGPGKKFLVFRVLKDNAEVLIGQNGAEYFK